MDRRSYPRHRDARAIAALVIQKLFETQKTLTLLLPEFLDRLTNRKDRALTQELCYGVMRWYHQLDYLAGQLLDKPIKDKDIDIKALLLIGLYQFQHLRIPPHAVVSATVEAAVELDKSWAKGLINAVLRRFQRESEHLLCTMETDEVAHHSHPAWLLELLKHDYPCDWQEIVAANNMYPPMALRVNSARVSREAYLDILNDAGISARAAPAMVPSGIILEHAVDVESLPHFNEGYVSVQDLAAQLTPSLLDLKPGLHVLDACAAPGGKLAHILEYEPGLGQVLGIEHDSFRFKRLQQTLARLQLKARLVQSDAIAIETWWDGIAFDRILLDAPCSATGVIRRHPDIKVLRKEADVCAVTADQAKLLSALWPLLKSGGKLLYVTCSILDSENDQQIEKFMHSHEEARMISIKADWGLATNYGRQILPGHNYMDGFYYACLQKN